MECWGRTHDGRPPARSGTRSRFSLELNQRKLTGVRDVQFRTSQVTSANRRQDLASLRSCQRHAKSVGSETRARADSVGGHPNNNPVKHSRPGNPDQPRYRLHQTEHKDLLNIRKIRVVGQEGLYCELSFGRWRYRRSWSDRRGVSLGRVKDGSSGAAKGKRCGRVGLMFNIGLDRCDRGKHSSVETESYWPA